ncbi:hypothetical protein M2132_000833 [Dysgonomonas sp. PH5-45]|uniref:hypothetical protein n=1 Tax=unclassified Dysgonomonas TaxID=2630389 RepID=UPI002473F90A|nr:MULTISPECIES: hypothetical protein [unclassified Dysgonomonas]MDH6354505.1 hypothetical protein [Dysgonomonas sp. PH5-45]MDH6387438.1 hypothetical protein [Dysgonomonas sp. PH5-37]
MAILAQKTEQNKQLFIALTGTYADVESIVSELIDEVKQLDAWFAKVQTVELSKPEFIIEAEVIKDDDETRLLHLYAMTHRLDALDELEEALRHRLTEEIECLDAHRIPLLAQARQIACEQLSA